jgi:hypothetical protein
VEFSGHFLASEAIQLPVRYWKCCTVNQRFDHIPAKGEKSTKHENQASQWKTIATVYSSADHVWGLNDAILIGKTRQHIKRRDINPSSGLQHHNTKWYEI